MMFSYHVNMSFKNFIYDIIESINRIYYKGGKYRNNIGFVDIIVSSRLEIGKQ